MAYTQQSQALMQKGRR